MKRHYRNSMLLLSLMLVASSCGEKKEAPPPAEQAQKDDQGVPKIFAAEPDYDFGQIKQGTEVSHIYKIKNVGTKELVIEKTHGS